MRTIHGEIEVDCPFSATIEYAEKYVSRLAWSNQGRLLTLWAQVVPSPGGRFALGWTVFARATVGRDQTDDARRHEAMWIRLRPARGLPFPHVAALLTARPLHRRTVLSLSAEYLPPFGALGRAFDAVVGRRLAEGALLGFLREMKGSIEAESREFVRAYAPEVAVTS
jgi:hypothetical protein